MFKKSLIAALVLLTGAVSAKPVKEYIQGNDIEFLVNTDGVAPLESAAAIDGTTQALKVNSITNRNADGAVNFPNGISGTISGDGSGLTNLDMDNASSGVLAVARGGTGNNTATGTGELVLNISPSLITPILGTPTSGTLTNVTGLPIVTGTTGTLSVARGGTGVTTSTGTGNTVLSANPDFTGTVEIGSHTDLDGFSIEIIHTGGNTTFADFHQFVGWAKRMRVTSASTHIGIDVTNLAASSGANLVLNETGGNVLIGTSTSSSGKLVSKVGASTYGISIENATVQIGGIYSNSGQNGELRLSDNGGTHTVKIASSGVDSYINGGSSLGLGTSAPGSDEGADRVLEISGGASGSASLVLTALNSSSWELFSDGGDDLTISRNGADHIKIDGSTGVVSVTGATALGAGSTGIKTKYLTGNTTAAGFNVAHGLTVTKIISFTTLLQHNNDTNAYYAPHGGVGETNTYYEAWLENTNIRFGSRGSSIDHANQNYKIYITYID